MMNALSIRWYQFLEVAKGKSLREAVQKSISAWVHLNRIVVPVYHDLSALTPVAKTGDAAVLEFLVVDSVNVDSIAPMNKLASRRLKGPCNIRAGYYAYVVVSNGEVIGDIWCATPRNIQSAPIHQDLSFLGIECGENEAYMFDMYVAPDARGKVITNVLLGNALHHLKESGFDRVYGFYEKNNLPALWIHRLFGYTELQKRKVCRVLLYQRSEVVTTPS